MIAPLPQPPRQDGELIFDAPWQARSFAMAVKLYESGWFSWQQWSERLAQNIARYEQTGEIVSSHDYYSVWQQTLEQLIDQHSA